jgi:hypothetical protein
MKQLFAILAVSLSVVGASCARTGDLEGPTHAAAEIRERVDAILVQRDIEPEKYEVTAFTFDYVDKQWAIYFLGIGANLDSHFAIMIDDNNPDDFRVVPGL